MWFALPLSLTLVSFLFSKEEVSSVVGDFWGTTAQRPKKRPKNDDGTTADRRLTVVVRKALTVAASRNACRRAQPWQAPSLVSGSLFGSLAFRRASLGVLCGSLGAVVASQTNVMECY
jgi:hypothetical protein